MPRSLVQFPFTGNGFKWYPKKKRRIRGIRTRPLRQFEPTYGVTRAYIMSDDSGADVFEVVWRAEHRREPICVCAVNPTDASGTWVSGEGAQLEWAYKDLPNVFDAPDTSTPASVSRRLWGLLIGGHARDVPEWAAKEFEAAAAELQKAVLERWWSRMCKAVTESMPYERAEELMRLNVVKDVMDQ